MGDKGAKLASGVMERALAHINEGKFLKILDLHEDERLLLREYGLITLKPVLYCANVDEIEIGNNERTLFFLVGAVAATTALFVLSLRGSQ